MAHFKQDRMTEKERLEALLSRQPIDRVPLCLYAFAFSTINVGYSTSVWYTEPEKSFEAMRHTHEMYDGWHWMYFSPGRFGTKEFGGEIKMPTGEYAQSASVLQPPVQSEEDVWKLEVPDVKTAGGGHSADDAVLPVAGEVWLANHLLLREYPQPCRLYSRS